MILSLPRCTPAGPACQEKDQSLPLSSLSPFSFLLYPKYAHEGTVLANLLAFYIGNLASPPTTMMMTRG